MIRGGEGVAVFSFCEVFMVTGLGWLRILFFTGTNICPTSLSWNSFHMEIGFFLRVMGAGELQLVGFWEELGAEDWLWRFSRSALGRAWHLTSAASGSGNSSSSWLCHVS